MASHATCARVVVRLDGFAGGPGYSVFHGADGSVLNGALQAFYNSMKVYLAKGVVVTFPSSGYNLTSATGVATGVWSSTAPSPVTSLGSSTYAAPAGCVVCWRTGGLTAKGHLIKGRTFIVPGDGQMFQNDGTLDNSFRSALLGYAATLISTGSLYVLSRPTTKGGSDGQANDVTSATVNDRAAILTSRR